MIRIDIQGNYHKSNNIIQVSGWELYKTQMGTNLLRLVPIHFRQPKLPQMPDYGYFSRLHLTLSNYLLPITL